MPLLQLALNSVIGRDSETLGLENYVRVFTTPLYQQSIWNSVWISLLSAVVGIVVAFLAARFAHEASPRVRNAFTMILNMMSNFSGVPLAFAFMILMGNAGVLTLIGQRFGIPLLANFDLYGADGLVIMYIYFQIPLATLLLIPAFAGIRKSWREAATILQASTFDYWFRIVIPNLMPSILGTLSVLFSNALAAYATAYALVMNNYALLALQITSRFKGDVQTDAATGGDKSAACVPPPHAARTRGAYFLHVCVIRTARRQGAKRRTRREHHDQQLLQGSPMGMPLYARQGRAGPAARRHRDPPRQPRERDHA